MILVAGWVLGCSPIQVSNWRDPSADFGSYRSYGWSSPQPRATGDPLFDRAGFPAHVRTAADRELAAAGLAPRQESPDLRVSFRVERKTQRSTVTLPGGSRGVIGAPRMPERDVDLEWEEGTLVFEVHETRGNALVWRASARADLGEGESLEARRARLDEAVQKSFREFPRRAQ